VGEDHRIALGLERVDLGDQRGIVHPLHRRDDAFHLLEQRRHFALQFGRERGHRPGRGIGGKVEHGILLAAHRLWIGGAEH
jgi:hypothetical protein